MQSWERHAQAVLTYLLACAIDRISDQSAIADRLQAAFDQCLADARKQRPEAIDPHTLETVQQHARALFVTLRKMELSKFEDDGSQSVN